jgi:NO-binding membrane sensor protein with MHYT domain
MIVAQTALSALTFMFRDDKHDKALKAVCATIMGFAIPAMHYTAMAAVTYTPMTEAPDLTNALDISALANTAIIAITFVVLGSVFFFQRWFEAPPKTAQSAT